MTRTRTRFQAIICLLLVFCMLLSSCGKKKDDGNGDDGQSSVGTGGDNTGSTGDGGTPPCSHATTALVGYKAPTCSEKGYTGDVVCTACTAVVTKGSETNMTEHSFDTVGKVTKEPTCISTGVKTFTCEGCGTTKTEPIATVAHKDVYHDVKDGTHFHTCRTCTLNETKEHTPIDPEGVPYAASCLEPAYVEYTCADCNGKYKVYDENSTAIGHAWGNWTVTKEATCVADGFKTQSCQNGCGAVNEIEIPATEQCEYVLVGYEKEPTCIADGISIYVCDGCDTEDRRTVKATGIHTYVDNGSDENWNHKICSNPECKNTISSYIGAKNQTTATITTEINTDTALEMEMEKAAIQFPSNVVSQIVTGEEVSISADVAEETKTNEAIDKVEDAAVKTALQNTTVYDFTVKVGENVFSTNFAEPVMITLPYNNGDNDADGIVIYYLAEDGTIQTITDVVYDADAKTVTFFVEHFSYYAVAFQETQEMRCKRGVHDYPETPSVSVNAACYTYGYQIFECKCCHKKTVENIVEKLDHNYGDVIEAKPTCDSGDYSHKICQNADCGHVLLIQFKGATGHAIDAPATCTTPATCTKCNNVVYRALGHSWTEWEMVVKPTEVTNGLRRRWCTTCEAKEEITLAATGNIETISYNSYEELMNLVFDKLLKLNSGSLAVELTAPGGSKYTVDIKVKKTDSGYTALMDIPAALTGVMEEGIDENVVIYYRNGVFVANIPGDAIYSSSMDNINNLPIEVFKAILSDVHAELNYLVENYIEMARALFEDYAPIISAEVDAVLAAAGSEFTVAEIEDVIDSVETVYAYLSLKLGYATNAEIIEGITLPETKDLETIVSAFMTLTEGEGGTKTYTFDLTKITDALNTVVDWLEEKSGETIAEFVYGLVGEKLVEMNEELVDFDALVDFIKAEVPGTLTIADAVDKLLGLLEDNEIVTIDSVYNLIDELAYKISGKAFNSKAYVKDNGTATLNDLAMMMSGEAAITFDELYDFVKSYANGSVIGDYGYMEMTVAGLVEYAKSMLSGIAFKDSGATFVFDANGNFVSFTLIEDLQMAVGEDEATGELIYESFEKAVMTVVRDDNVVIELPEKMAAGMLDVKQSYDADGNLIVEGLDDSFDLTFGLEGYGEFNIKDVISVDEKMSALVGYTVYVIDEKLYRAGKDAFDYYYIDGKYYLGKTVSDIKPSAEINGNLTALVSDPMSFIPTGDTAPDGYIKDNKTDSMIPAWDLGIGVAYQEDGVWMFAQYRSSYTDDDDGTIIYSTYNSKTYEEFANVIQVSSVNDNMGYFVDTITVDGEEYDILTVYYYVDYYSTESSPCIIKDNEILTITYPSMKGEGHLEITEVTELPSSNEYKVEKYTTTVTLEDGAKKNATVYRYCVPTPVYFVKLADGLYCELNTYTVSSEVAVILPYYMESNLYVGAYESIQLPDGNTLYIKGVDQEPDKDGLITVYGYAKTVDGLYIQTICKAKGESIVEVTYREAIKDYSASYDEVYNINGYVTKLSNGKYKISKAILDELKAYCTEPDSGFFITVEAEKTVDGQKYSNMYSVGSYYVKPEISLGDLFGGFHGSSAMRDPWEHYFGGDVGVNDYEVKLNEDGSLTIYFENGKTINSIKYNFGNRFPADTDKLVKDESGKWGNLDIYKLEFTEENDLTQLFVYKDGKYHYYSTPGNYDLKFVVNPSDKYAVTDMRYQFDTLLGEGLEEGIPVYRTEISFRKNLNWFYDNNFITVYTLIVDGQIYVATEAEITGESVLKFESYVPLDEYITKYLDFVTADSDLNLKQGTIYYNGVNTAYGIESFLVYEKDADGNRLENVIGQIDFAYVTVGEQKKYVYDDIHLTSMIVIGDEAEVDESKYYNISTESSEYYNETVTIARCSYTQTYTSTQYFVKLAGKYYRFDEGCRCSEMYYGSHGCYWCASINQDEFNNEARDKVWYYLLTDEYGNTLGYYTEFTVSDDGFVPANPTTEGIDGDMINMLLLGYTTDGNMLYEVSFWVDTAAGKQYTTEEIGDGTVFYHVNGIGYLKDQNGRYIPARKMQNTKGEYEIVCRIHSAYVNNEYLSRPGVLDAFVEMGIGKNYITISPELLEIAKANRNVFRLLMNVNGSGEIDINYYVLEALFEGKNFNDSNGNVSDKDENFNGGTMIDKNENMNQENTDKNQNGNQENVDKNENVNQENNGNAEEKEGIIESTEEKVIENK